MSDHKIPIPYQSRSRSEAREPRPPGLHDQATQNVPDDEAEQSVREAIAAASSRNAELLAELSATADAMADLANNERKLEHTNKRLAQQRHEVFAAVNDSEITFERHKKFRDSIAKRLVYKLISKKDVFDAKAMQEEETYHDALERRGKAETQLTELQTTRANLLAEAEMLKRLAKRHGEAHAAIDRLYTTLFDGPTPGFPDEDEQESNLQQAKEAHAAKTKELMSVVAGVKAVMAIKTVIDLVTFEKTRAAVESRSPIHLPAYLDHRLQRCVKYTKRGLELSNLAIDGIQGPLDSDLAEAKSNFDYIFQSVEEAVLRRERTRNGGIATAEKIATAVAEASPAQKRFVEKIKQTSLATRLAIRGTARTLENERQALQQIRQSAFEVTVGFGAAAPAYHECCDRAAGFENDSDARSASIADPVVHEMPEMPPPDYEGAVAS